jgi:hypothetical protein
MNKRMPIAILCEPTPLPQQRQALTAQCGAYGPCIWQNEDPVVSKKELSRSSNTC